MKPTANQVARAATLAAHVGYTYDELDCQAFVEHCVRQAGGRMDYLGTNDMARRAAWLGTLDEARAQGRLVPGAGLLIREATEANLPARYAGDGLGDFSHVGLYVGENALTDTDKNGRRRACDVVHSSATMGRVAGSTLQNGWTHAGYFREIEYGDGDSAAPVPSTPPSSQTLGSRTLKRGDTGSDVQEMQANLMMLGYDLGSYGADGDFGSRTEKAVMAFQRSSALDVDGKFGPKSFSAMKSSLASIEKEQLEEQPEQEAPPSAAEKKIITVTANSVNARVGDSTEYDSVGRLDEGESIEYVATAPNGWNAGRWKNRIVWISPEFSKVT